MLTVPLSSCEKLELEVNVPNCIEQQIREIKQEDVRNPPAKVWQWKVDNKIYYYITSDCCDQFNYLYDSNCNVVCAPDGGITGAGDGRCPDFNGQVEQTLIWEDDRN
ncbi:DUF6970 domain-containing protein [Pontibacter rufus]|uniref:DUF6970 domain-containing protein n=1 Tax=Pontibacter rufus TaxID=2791028 RepID=UPI001E4A7040|nr:hypothetical protein [Pontibacter sp. 172403-2]